MKLIDVVRGSERRLVAPIMSYPGIRFTNTTALENLTDSDTQCCTIQEILAEYDPDIVLPFMDLTVEPEALGLPIIFKDNESPTVARHPVRLANELEQWKLPDPRRDGRMPLFLDITRNLKKFPGKMVGAYVSGPFTLAGLLMGAERLAISTMMDPEFVRATVDFATRAVIPYAQAQEAAGADFIVLLDPTGVLMSPALYDEFVGGAVRRVAQALRIPLVLHTCGDTTALLPNMCRTGVQGLSLDGAVDFPAIADRIPEDIVLLGNLDPVRVMLNLKPRQVWKETMKFLDDMKEVPNFILSTGCDLPLETPEDNVHAFCKAARDWRRQELYYNVG